MLFYFFKKYTFLYFECVRLSLYKQHLIEVKISNFYILPCDTSSPVRNSPWEAVDFPEHFYVGDKDQENGWVDDCHKQGLEVAEKYQAEVRHGSIPEEVSSVPNWEVSHSQLHPIWEMGCT